MTTLETVIQTALALLCWSLILVGIVTHDAWMFAVGATLAGLTLLREIAEGVR